MFSRISQIRSKVLPRLTTSLVAKPTATPTTLQSNAISAFKAFSSLSTSNIVVKPTESTTSYLFSPQLVQFSTAPVTLQYDDDEQGGYRRGGYGREQRGGGGGGYRDNRGDDRRGGYGRERYNNNYGDDRRDNNNYGEERQYNNDRRGGYDARRGGRGGYGEETNDRGEHYRQNYRPRGRHAPTEISDTVNLHHFNLSFPQVVQENPELADKAIMICNLPFYASTADLMEIYKDQLGDIQEMFWHLRGDVALGHNGVAYIIFNSAEAALKGLEARGKTFLQIMGRESTASEGAYDFGAWKTIHAHVLSDKSCGGRKNYMPYDRSCFIGNIPFDTNEAELKDAFEECGKISNISLARWKETGKLRGFGFLVFEDPEGKGEAKNRDGFEFNGRSIYVSDLRTQEKEDGQRIGVGPPPMASTEINAQLISSGATDTGMAVAFSPTFGEDAFEEEQEVQAEQQQSEQQQSEEQAE